MECQYSENHVIHFSPLLVEISMLVSKTISPKPQKPSGSSFLSPMSFLVFNAFTSAGDDPSSPLGSALDRIYSDHSSGSKSVPMGFISYFGPAMKSLASFTSSKLSTCSSILFPSGSRKYML